MSKKQISLRPDYFVSYLNHISNNNLHIYVYIVSNQIIVVLWVSGACDTERMMLRR